MPDFRLTLGLPHTNRWGLAEHLLLMHAGHLHWASIAAAIRVPLSALRTMDGGAVYATFYFIDTEFPDRAPLDSFRLDDEIVFRGALRASKRIVVEGQFIFDRPEHLPAAREPETADTIAAARGRHPYLRFANIFITPERGNSRLRVAPPANGDFSGLPRLDNADNPYTLTRAAAESGALGLLDDAWQAVELPDAEAVYAIDPERDSNGAGLTYFANYVAFMDAAERTVAARSAHPALQGDGRITMRRRIAFYGNVALTDMVRTHVRWFHDPARPSLVAARYAVRRAEDGQLICLSEAVKRVTHRR